MKNHWLAALLCAFLVVAATGCGTPGGQDKGRRRATAPQTGTNIPRWTDDSPRARNDRAKQRKARPKREKTKRSERPKRERQERTRRTDEDVIIRGGFR